jgi:hypothetical protein
MGGETYYHWHIRNFKSTTNKTYSRNEKHSGTNGITIHWAPKCRAVRLETSGKPNITEGNVSCTLILMLSIVVR